MNFHTATALDPNTATKQDHQDRDYIRDSGGKGFAIRLQGHYSMPELEQALACLKEADKEFAASSTPARRIPAAARALCEAAGSPDMIEGIINDAVGAPMDKGCAAALKGYNLNRIELAQVLDQALTMARAKLL